MSKLANAKISASNLQITDNSYFVEVKPTASYSVERDPPKNLLASKMHVTTEFLKKLRRGSKDDFSISLLFK